MEKNHNQKHTKETLYFVISRMLERASYYGLRVLVVLFMTGEILKMDRTEAYSIFSWFSISLIISQIIGAFFGDLLIGNKKSIIIGGIMQAIGVFAFCIPSITALYLGLFLVALGSGFFTPNLISNFGKLYLDKTKLLDSGFTILYLAINLGSFFGILLIGYLGEIYGYNIGFILAGILMLLSIIPVIFTKEISLSEIKKSELPTNKRVFKILITFFAVVLFWGIYEISNIRILDLELQIKEISTLEFPKYVWQSGNFIFILPISIIAIVFWSYFYNSQLFKLIFGFVFGVISFGILFLIPEIPTEKHAFTYLVSLLFLGISEIHIAPLIYSILTKYSNPKYLAILISLSFLPTRLISLTVGLFNDRLYENPILALKIGIIAMSIIGLGLIGYVWWNKKHTLFHVKNLT